MDLFLLFGHNCSEQINTEMLHLQLLWEKFMDVKLLNRALMRLVDLRGPLYPSHLAYFM